MTRRIPGNAAPVDPVLAPPVLGPRPEATGQRRLTLVPPPGVRGVECAEGPLQHAWRYEGALQRTTPPPVAAPAPRPRFRLPVPAGQIACWQVSLTLIGMTAGQPLPVAGPAMGCAAVLLVLTVPRVRNRWLYQWIWHYSRFRRRERGRHLPQADGPRAVLHLFAPDATVSDVRHDDGAIAVVHRAGGATAVLRPRLSNGDPVGSLPRPRTLVAGDGMAVQLVLHGTAGGRSAPLAWLAVHQSDEDDLLALGVAVRRVYTGLVERDIGVTGLDRDDLLRTVASLAHVGEHRRDVRERWRCWQCGPVAQVAFRLRRWASLPDPDARQLLDKLLTTATGAVVTVAVVAGGEAETATMRVAATGMAQLEQSVRRLRAIAGAHGVRLDRMNGEHATGVAAVLPLGASPPPRM